MAALVGVPPDFGALATPHVPLQFMDRCCLRSPHDIEGNGLMLTTQAFHFEIAKPRVDRISQCGRRLCWTVKAEHALVPRLAGELVGLFARFRRALRRRPDRTAVNAFARLGTHTLSKRVQPPGANRPWLAVGRCRNHGELWGVDGHVSAVPSVLSTHTKPSGLAWH